MAAAGINGVNVGRDVTLSVVQPSGGTLSIDITTSFDSRARYDRRRTRPLNSAPISVPIPDGWEGTFEIERINSTVEQFFALIESGYFNGQGIASGSISETILNASDGSTSTFQYTKVMFMLEDAGRKQADDVIKIRIAWEASRRTQL